MGPGFPKWPKPARYEVLYQSRRLAKTGDWATFRCCPTLSSAKADCDSYKVPHVVRRMGERIPCYANKAARALGFGVAAPRAGRTRRRLVDAEHGRPFHDEPGIVQE